ncbi:MAG TPA: DnaB-like helicase C-terminal domain-containing protein [Bacteroidales bacterium]|nr:DnaB-like helicase C-terminal domain-containing protein [Bacteroidales bacterium]
MSDKERKNETYIVSAEYQILKLIADNPELLDIHPELNIENFPHAEARDLFSAIVLLHKSKEQINTFSLLRESNKLNENIDVALIERILTIKVDSSSFKNSIELLKKESVKYKLSLKLNSLYKETSILGELNTEKVQNVLWDTQQLVSNAGERIDLKTLPECLDNYIEDLKKRKIGEYYSFGDVFLDTYLTRKASGGQIILISAATGMGKSAYTLQLINGMINLNIPAMYISLEMDEISTFDRFLAMRTGVPISDWYVKDNIDTLIPKVQKEKIVLEDKPFRFIDNPNLSLAKIQSLIRQFKTFYKTDYVCVYIDLITQVKEFIDLESGNLASTIERAVNILNSIAKEENVCFVCVAQMKRAIDDIKITKVEDTEKLKPTLGGIKNSGALAERSRAVLSIFRARPYIEKYLPNDPKLEFMEDIMEVTVLKQNQGGIGHGKYLFNPKTMMGLPYKEEDIEINF